MSALADFLSRHAPGYLQRHGGQMARAQVRALGAITRCRTPAMGGQRYHCTACAKESFGWHSCHHRACPRCGGAETAAWTRQQLERLLPVPYFLVTFTLPDALRQLTRERPEVLLDLLFQASARALQATAAEPRLLGGELGFMGVLQTWTRQLLYHPHVHYIVPGGGLRPDRARWMKCRNPEWFLPGPVLSARFREQMEVALRAAAPELHARVPADCWRGKWVVDCKAAGSGEAALKYLARYVHRTAISDERILETNEESVRFKYTDSKTKQVRECTVAADEFMRRYLQHVLPEGLHRVRYFGWMHPAARRRRCVVETLLSVKIVVRPPAVVVEWHLRCPHCEQFALVVVARLKPCRGPPQCLAA